MSEGACVRDADEVGLPLWLPPTDDNPLRDGGGLDGQPLAVDVETAVLGRVEKESGCGSVPSTRDLPTGGCREERREDEAC